MTTAGPVETRTVKSFCRVCTALCGVLVDVTGDEVVRVRGDPDHPLSRGYTCPKGRGLPQMHHHPDRIERPQVRVDGHLQPTTWDDCLDDLAGRLRAVIDADGPSAVAVFFGSGVGMDAAGYRTAEALYRAIGTRARMSPLTIDGTAKALVSHLMGGFPGLNARPDYDRAALVVLIGVNPVVSHGHTVAVPDPVSALRALAASAELWVLDPRRTETARLATHALAPRPGTDYAVLAYLVREVLRDGAVARGAGPAQGIEELAAAVAPFTVEHAAALAGVAPDDLRALSAAVRRAGRVAIDTGTGVTMAPSANVTQWLAWALMVLTGSMNRPGGVWFHPGFLNRLDATDLPVAPPERAFGPGPATRPGSHSFLGEWPCAVLADEVGAGTIRAVLNLGGHLVTAFPDTTALVPALRSLDVLATIEIIGNATTALSTHVLPTKDQLERADVTLWDFLSPRVAAQHTPAVVEAVGDRRSTWWVLAELGRRLGYDLGAADRSDDDVLAGLMARARCTFDDLAATGVAEAPHELPAPWVDRHVERLGGWRLAPPMLVEQLGHLRPPPPLSLVPRRQVRHVNSQLVYLGDRPEVLLHPDDARAAGVADGGEVIVRSAQGSLTAIARVDGSVRPGVVSVPHGHEGANVNVLTSREDLDPLTGMTRYSGVEVALEPVT